MAIIPGEIGKNIVVETPEKRKVKSLLTVFILLVIVIAAVLYFSFFSGTKAPSFLEGGQGELTGVASAQQQLDKSVKILEELRSVELNNQIFANKKFSELILSDRLPVVVGEKGRANPFLPF